ncbi:hypothetical protein PENSPDRAFT_752121 [Peniophora sp. CONT]|nr:hypothetical protein PENSPDRAFT_752121 [Peniophora sp. CONT]
MAATAQNLTIPATWRNPTSNLSLESREGLAYEAAQPFSVLDISVGKPGLPWLQEVTSVYAVLALQDYYTGNSSWGDIGTVNFPAAIQGKNGFWASGAKLYSDVIYWGLAFFYAHRTYNEPVLLSNAVDAWNILYDGAFITPDNAASGSGAGRNVSFLPPANCTSATFAGGVFYMQGVQTSTYVNMISIGPFMTLSAYLFEETKNATYQQMAQLSLDFIINHLWNGTIVYDGIELTSCQTTPKPFSLNQAWFVEGLSVWANVTQNDTLNTLLENVVQNVTTFPTWSAQDGVVNDVDPEVTSDSPNQILKGIYIRGLSEARMRNPETDLARYIEGYITVQYNSILDHARAPNSSNYSRAWIGPPLTSFEAGGNLAALDVLNAAISFNGSSTASSNSSTGGTTPTGSSRPTSAKSSKSKAGAIAGGVIGGVAFAAIATTAAILLLRHRKHARGANGVQRGSNTPRTTTVQPFISGVAVAYTPPTNSKSARRMNYQNDGPSLPTSHPTSTAFTTNDLSSNYDGIAELPSLIQRLNNVLQGRETELPPRYDS